MARLRFTIRAPVCWNVVLPVEKFSSNGELCLNCLCQPRGQAHIDTSAVLDGWSRYYPPDVFESLWQNLEDLVRRQNLCAPDEVLEELSKKLDDAFAWAKRQEGMFVELDDDVQAATTEILAAYPQLSKGRPIENKC